MTTEEFMKMLERQHNCTSPEDGVSCNRNCEGCGFDKQEQKRRSHIPLTKDADGLYRKHVWKEKSPARR